MRNLVGLICLSLLCVTAHAITPEELARLSEKGAADKRQVDRQLKLDDLHYNITPEQTDPAGKTDVVRNTKKTNRDAVTVNNTKTVNTPHSQSLQQAHKYPSTQPAVPHPQDVRNAARRHDNAPVKRLATTTAQPVYTDAVSADSKRHYGIQRGSWLRAELRRNINNAEPGDVELYIVSDVYGRKNTLPAQTQLFAAKALNTATQRLDMLTSYAITPDGREFALKARIYDTTKVSGLMGIIDADESKIAERGVSNGLAALGNSLLDEVGSQGIVGRGLAKGGQSVLKDSQRAAQLDTQQQITIFVAPQPVLLRVEESF